LKLEPPTDAEVEQATHLALMHRTCHRSSPLSTVEKAVTRREDGSRVKVILKTMRPVLSHEPVVYNLLDSFAVRAAELLGRGRTHRGVPWMLLTDVGDDDISETDESAISTALEHLSEVHRHYMGDPSRLQDVPRWGPSWLVSQADWLCDTLPQYAAYGGSGLTDDLLAEYRQRLIEIDEVLRPFAATLVHGDFDPGNLIRLPNGNVAALDWGLSHINTPWVDLAHMVERFEDPVRSRLVDRYLELGAENSDISRHTAVVLGGAVHRAFFVCWHTQVIESGWGSPEDYLDAIVERVQHIVAAEPMR
jgi:hypothetical protein